MKKLVIYGAGNRGIRFYKYIRAVGLEHIFYAFCDRDYSNKKVPFADGSIFPYEQIKEKELVYLISIVQYEEVAKMLEADKQEYYVSPEEILFKYYSDNKNIMELFSTEEFKLNDNNELLYEYYSKPNYKTVQYEANHKLCYIFFSGNGIYYPNDKGTFLRTIKAEERFEWENVVKFSDIPQKAGKCIYVRDLHKTWYVTGISNKIDSIDKLINVLKELTDGYEVITVGNSAGGYIASLVGAKLKAMHAFNFSGQFSLYENAGMIQAYYWLDKYKEDELRCRYYNICKYIKNTIPIIYFYPEYCEQDKKQSVLVEEYSNVLSFPINSERHGQTLSNEKIACLLTLNLFEIQELYRKYGKRVMDSNEFIL